MGTKNAPRNEHFPMPSTKDHVLHTIRSFLIVCILTIVFAAICLIVIASATADATTAYAETLELSVSEKAYEPSETVIEDDIDYDTSEIEYQTEEPDYVQYYYEPEYTYEYDEEYAPSYDCTFQQMGVIYENDTRYTWYSSNVLYHYRTSEWSPDEQGIYRDADGYIVVASSDYDQNTVVDTPFGPGIVYDSGCPSGTIDIYVNF